MRDGLQKLEKQKCEHQQHLLIQMAAAANKVDGFVSEAQGEASEYEERENGKILQERKKLKYERIRITECKSEVQEEIKQADELTDQVEQKVQLKCKSQFSHLQSIHSECETLDSEIDALMQQVRKLEI